MQFGSPEERFWANVVKTDGCWVWQGAPKSREGYGEVYVRGAHIGAHRFSWELHHGPIPEGLFACHNCPGGDNPRCVNPAHLFLGTPKANSEDMVAKGRSAKGERNANHRLTLADVAAIRHANAEGRSAPELAIQFQVSRSTIYYILQGKLWRA